jgi:hypothetical protein
MFEPPWATNAFLSMLKEDMQVIKNEAESQETH